MKERAAQVRKTIVEVAAHSYETAAKPWEKTGETHTSWSKRNSLKYSRSLGDPLRDPFARALAHLYDEGSDSEFLDTENISLNHPYVPTVRLPPETVEQRDSLCAGDPQSRHPRFANNNIATVPEVSATPVQYPSLAQSALDWGSETLQTLRLYWDGGGGSNGSSGTGAHGGEAPTVPLPSHSGAKPHEDDNSSSSIDSYEYEYEHRRNETLGENSSDQPHQNGPTQPRRRTGSVTSDSSISSDDSFYKLSQDDKTRAGTRYGLQPVERNTAEDLGQSTQPGSMLRPDTEPAVGFDCQQNGKEAVAAIPHRNSNDEPHQGANVSKLGPKR
ncbi:hypothetical protein GGI22_007757, partial [Coemansia erecta]